MRLKRAPPDSGLGDRLGNYLVFSMLGYIYDATVYTYWDKNGWSGEYPADIHEYIQFPKNLVFVAQEEFDALEAPLLEYRWVYHGFDYIPETLYRSLVEDGQISCSFPKMIGFYRRACREMTYKKLLPRVIATRPGALHLRRGDKGTCSEHDNRIRRLITDPKMQHKCKAFIVLSDSQADRDKYAPDQHCFSRDPKVAALEEFFTCAHCKIIVQSVVSNGQGHYGGWSGFSYVPFQLGMAMYPDSPPWLVSMSESSGDSRLPHARRYAQRPLTHIVHADQLLSKADV